MSIEKNYYYQLGLWVEKAAELLPENYTIYVRIEKWSASVVVKSTFSDDQLEEFEYNISELVEDELLPYEIEKAVNIALQHNVKRDRIGFDL